MAQVETWFSQDLKQAVKVQYIDGNVFSQDNNGNIIGVEVFDNGEPATLSGTVAASIIRADGVTVAATGTLSGNRVSVALPQAAYSVPGVLSVVIKLTSGNDVTTLCAVVGNVYQSTTDSVVDPGTIIPSIDDLIAEIEAAVASIPADYSDLWETIAPPFSTGNAYAVGQYVTYDGAMYRCTTEIQSGESWTASHWTSVDVGTEIFATNEIIDRSQVTKVDATLQAETGVYVNTGTGAVSSNANFCIARDSNNERRVEIPRGCRLIVFNNIRLNQDSNAGWATYSKNQGSSTSAFIRGGKTAWIVPTKADKYFAVCNFKDPISGAFIDSFSVTFVFAPDVYANNCAINIVSKTESKETILGYYVNRTTGAVAQNSLNRYAYVPIQNIPYGATRIKFDNAVMLSEGSAGWAVYDNTSTFIRGGYSNYIDVQAGDAQFQLSTYGQPPAGSLTFEYIFGKLSTKVDEIDNRVEALETAEHNTNSLSNYGQNVVMLGDSIIGNFDGDDSIPGYLAGFTNGTFYNCGFGGSSMGSDLVDPDAYLEAFNGWKLIHAITTNNYTAMQTAIDNDPNFDHLKPNYQAHLNTLKNMDWSNVDVITLSYGTNDWGTRVVLDDPNNPMSTDTFTGAIRTALLDLWATYPHIKVVAFGVIWRGLTISGGQITGDSDDGKHGRNWYLKEYEDAAKGVCEEYHVPFVRMYDYTNFNRYTWTSYFGATDATHPNANGRKVMAKRYAAHMIEISENN